MFMLNISVLQKSYLITIKTKVHFNFTHLFCCRNVYNFILFQAEDGIRDVERSRGLGDVYKRQVLIVKHYITNIKLCIMYPIYNL